MQKEILLEDLLRVQDIKSANRIKVRFIQYNGLDDPMELYKSNPAEINETWLFWNGKIRPFSIGDIAICLLKIANNRWLLTTIKEVTEEFGIQHNINYNGIELDEYKHYFGRVIVTFHKTSQQQCHYYEKIKNNLVINQILPDMFDGDDFPGYDKVRLSYSQLKTIIDRNKKDWVAALSNQKGVYLITDTFTGKLYVGSATSEYGMLLQRWQNYIANGHGGNRGLLKLIEAKGFAYIKKYFQYSLLENYNARVEDSIILARESWWKNTLCSRIFGYNEN